jgi:acyl-CoA synthetase (NDP forming)
VSGGLEAVLAPRSVAVLGASADPQKLGGRPIRFLLASGFRGAIYPVNPKAAEVQGLAAFPDIAQVPGSVDHAVIALPAEAVLPAARACAAKGVRGLTVFSAGFAEVGGEGTRLQEELAAIGRASGMRIIGPNCMGLINLRTGFTATFGFMVELGLPPVGRVALVSQSGAFGGQALLMARQRGLPLGAWITTGNEADVQLADCIAHFAADDDTDVILGYMEGCRDAARLVSALALARERGKKLVMVKAGSSQAGGAAVQSHTGALAGNDRVFDAVFRQYGVLRAESIESFFDVASTLAAGKRVREGSLGVFTVSGGIGVLVADAAEAAGLSLPPLPAEAQAALKRVLPMAAVRNPVDGTAQIWSDWKAYGTFLHTLLAESGCECLMLCLTAMPWSVPLQRPLAQLLREMVARYPERLIVACTSAPDDFAGELRSMGIVVFEDATRAVRAVAALKRLARPPATPAPPGAQCGARWSFTGTPSEVQARRLLAEAGLPFAPGVLVRTVKDALAAASEVGYPVALKLVSADLPHKSDVGGVILDLADEAGLRRAWQRLEAVIAGLEHAARLDGVLVSPMVKGGIELLLGTQRDPVFGPVVLVGLGGVHAELFGDVALRLAPIGAEEGLAMLRELKGFALLDGARGRPKVNLAPVAAAIARLSEVAAANADVLESIDINPCVVLPSGRVLGLDALIVPRERS